MDWQRLLNVENLALAIPVVAILVGGIIAIVAMWFSHRERMGMIEQGIHPDHPPDEVEAEEDPASRY